MTFIQSMIGNFGKWRDKELVDSDWTQLINSPLDSATVEAWATYRQGLRNLPKQNVAPRLIVIPTRP